MNKLERLRELAAKATHARWGVIDDIIGWTLSSEKHGDLGRIDFENGDDAELICEMRNNIEAMIEVVEAAKDEIEVYGCDPICPKERLCCTCDLQAALAKLEK